ncbi:hypothetical protein JCM8547_006538 [Rhodosporidiobolus lusitaniae]
MCSENAVSFLRALPKCEHHIHIEGSLEPEMLFFLAKKNGIELDKGMYSTIEALEERYRNFTSLDDFLAYFNRAMDVLLTPSDFSAIAYAYLQRTSRDGLAYAEIFFDPQAHNGRGVELETVVKGLREGLERGEREFGVKTRLVACLEKHLPVEDACEMVQSLKPYVGKEVIGLGADSTEKGNHPTKFTPAYFLARSLGLTNLTMHSGEEGPASWVRSSLADVGVSRIDHGVRAADDLDLLEKLARDGTMLTLCPLSNVRLCVHKDVRESPIPLFLEKGVPFSINSDDPAYFGGYILDNFIAVQDAFSLPKSTWRMIVLNSINGSWCDEGEKERLKGRLEDVMLEWEGKEI